VGKEAATELTVELVREYAVAGPRMPARDLNTLVRMGLAHQRDHLYMSAIDRLQAWVSPVAEPQDIAQEELQMLEDLPGSDEGQDSCSRSGRALQAPRAAPRHASSWWPRIRSSTLGGTRPSRSVSSGRRTHSAGNVSMRFSPVPVL
jgi:hypothetical protein